MAPTGMPIEFPPIPEPPAGQIMVCFQVVTQGGAVVDTEPEPWPDIDSATKRAKEWMELRGKTIHFTTFEGDGAVIKTDTIEHIAVMRAQKMMDLYQEAVALATQEKENDNHE